MIHVESARPTSIRWQVFALACAASFLLNLHRYTWNIVGPSLKDALRLTNTEVGFLFSLFYYTYAAGQIPSGVVIDRLGPHRVLSVSIITWSLALGLTGQTSVLWLPALCRLAFGLGQAGCYPSLAKVTRSWFPLNRRTAMQGWIATAFGRGGGALSPILLATVLMGTCGFSWQTSLLILALIGIGFAAVFWWFFRSSTRVVAGAPGGEEQKRLVLRPPAVPRCGIRRGVRLADRVLLSASTRLRHVEDRLVGEPATLGRRGGRHPRRLAERSADRRDGQPQVVA
jgi:sugar phosphate permease